MDVRVDAVTVITPTMPSVVVDVEARVCCKRMLREGVLVK